MSWTDLSEMPQALTGGYGEGEWGDSQWGGGSTALWTETTSPTASWTEITPSTTTWTKE